MRLKQFMFALVAMLGFAVSASAQQNISVSTVEELRTALTMEVGSQRSAMQRSSAARTTNGKEVLESSYTITVSSDMGVDELMMLATVGEKQKVTIDLNGHTLTGKLINNGVLTIIDSSNPPTGAIVAEGGVAIENNGTIALNSGNIIATTALDNNGTAYIQGASLIGAVEGVDNYENAVAGIINVTLLQKAIDLASSNTEIKLAADITGDVKITQKEGVNIVIDGDGKKFTGIMTVFGDARHDGAETLAIKNVNFVAKAGADACILSPDRTAQNPARYSYSHNVTVENCTFTDPDGTVNCAAIRQGDGGDRNWTVTKCTVDATMHSLLQVNNVEEMLTVTECTVKSKNGLNLNATINATITGNNIDVNGYAVRTGVKTGGNLGTAKTLVLENNTLKSACADGDAVIMFRASSVDMDLSMTKNVVDGTTHISGNTADTKIAADANYWNGAAAPVVAGTEIKVNSYYTDAALNNLERNEMGSIYAYVSADRVFGGVTSNAAETLVITLYGADGNVVGTTSLENEAHRNGTIKELTWRINFGADDSGSWAMQWENGAPSIDNLPAKVKLAVDGVEVAESDIKFTADGDGRSPVVAAKTDADGKILSFIACDGEYNLNNAANKLVSASADGDNIAILVAGTYNMPTDKDLTITGAVDGVVFDNIGAKNMGGANVTFNNVTFDYYPNVNYTGLQHSGNLVYNDCTINGQVFLYGQSETFNKCTFNQNSADAYNVWTYGAKEVAFNECTFNSAGKSVLVYTEDENHNSDIAVTASTFNASQAIDGEGEGKGKAAIEMDASLQVNGGITLTVDAATTATGFSTNTLSGSSLWHDKKVVEGKYNGGTNTEVTIAGTVVKEAAARSLAGSGTAEAPYTINNLAELIWFAEDVNAGNKYQGKVVQLTADIDLKSEPWTPIATFNGVFDGNDKTISNLVVNGEGKSNQGFFGNTNNGEIKNLTINNATVTGRLNVGVVAGTPYTSKYTNIKVTGYVVVEGMAYVGGVGGKDAYANWTDITVDVNDGSYVKATSTEGGTAYRTYVGGVIGFNGEGGHTFKNISSNIKVIGDVCDIGGIFGILHYSNNAENVTFTGSVEAPAGAKEVGAIAGVWHNEKGTDVEISDITSTGTVTVGGTVVEGAIVGGAYNASNVTPGTSGSLKIDGEEAWLSVAKIGDTNYRTVAAALAAAKDGETVALLWNEGDPAIAMSGSVFGKNVTITGTATVDWSKDFLFVGRGGEGNATVTFDGANLTSASNSASAGIHVSGREKNTDNKYDGTVVIKNSTIVLDYLINKGTMSLDNSTLTVKNGFSIGGRPASETESGEDATATISLANNSKVVVNNHNGMGIGYEAIGEMTVDATSTFEHTQDFLVTAKGTMDIKGALVSNGKTITNNGEIKFTEVALTGATIEGTGTTRFYNTINFNGANSIKSGIDGTPFELVVNKGANLLISRFVLGYDRNITVYGEIEDASTFNPAGQTPSLKFNNTSGVSVGGTGVGNITAENAYIELDNSSWKNSYATHTWNFKNCYVSATSLGNNNGPGADAAKWDVTFDNSVVVAKNYIKNGKNTTYSFENGSVGTTGSLRIDGILNIDATSSVTTTAQQNNVVGAEDEHGGINGTANIAGTLTIGSTSKTQLEVLGGTVNVAEGATVALGNNSLTLDATSTLSSKGSISGAITADESAKVEISGGSYTQDVTDWCVLGYVATKNADGTYSVADDPTTHYIADVDGLKAFRDDVNAGNPYEGITVHLTSDIDLAGENWTPIGNITYDSKYKPTDASKVFSGVFNGNGKVISNLKVESTVGDADTQANVGLFGITGAGAVIKDLTLTNVNINTDGRNVGAIAGFAYKATLKNITVNGNIQIEGGNNVAGIAGMTRYYDMSATDITVRGDNGSAIVGNNIVGGIFAEIAPNGSVQEFKGLNIENVAVTGASGVGGIVGLLTTGAIENVSVKNVVLTGRTDYQGNAMGRIRLGSVAGLMGGKYATIANETVENVTAKNLDGNAVELPVIGANYDAASNATEAKIGNTYYNTLLTALGAAKANETIVLISNIDTTGAINILAGKKLVLDLNGKTITGTDNATASYGLININPGAELTINDTAGNGAIRLTATNDRDWNAYSSVISNQRGKLVVNGGTIEHLGGTDMAYGIDNLTNGQGTYAETVINGGTIKSTYRAIRQFLNGTEAQNILTINGGTVEGANKSVWMQDPSAKANTGTLTIAEYAKLKGDVYLYVTPESTSWPVEVSIAAAALQGESKVMTGNVPAGYELAEVNGTYGVYTGAAKIGTVYYATIAEAINAAQAGETVIELLDNATFDYNARDAYGTAETTSVTINGNGHTLTLNQKNSDWASIGLANAAGKIVLNDMTIEKTGYGDTSGAWNTHAIIFSCPVEMNNVTVNNGIAVQAGATLNSVTINEANGYYGLWINGNGQSVTVNGGEINATNGGRGIKIADEYIASPAKVTLSVKDTKFSTAKKAAVLVSSKAGADIAASNVNIENVAEDKVNFVWVDEDWAQYFANVTVTGATVAQESMGDFAVTINNSAYFKTLTEAIAAAKAGETVTLLADINENVTINKSVTIDGAGKQYTGTMTGNAGQTITVQNVNFVNGGFDKSTKSTSGTYTIKDCTFDGAGTYAYAFRFRGANKVVVENCTVRNYLYSFLYVPSSTDTVSVKNVTVEDCPNYAVYFASGVTTATFENLTVKNSNNGFVINNTANRAFTIKNCTMENVTTAINYSNGTSDITCTVLGVNDFGTAALPDYVKANAVRTGTKYCGTLAEAVEVAETGALVELLASKEGAGVVINKNLTIDFKEKTYTVNKAVGSTGTETLGFQILKNNNVTLKNGTLTSTTPVAEGKEVKMLIQNYANLTLENMNLVDATEHILYVLSNNCGSTEIKGATNITTDAVAFDVYDYTSAGYAVPNVTVSTIGKIEGKIEVSENINDNLQITSGTYTMDVTEWCADDLAAAANGAGEWSIVPAKVRATLADGRVYGYATLAEAVNGIQGDATIMLLDDLALDTKTLAIQNDNYATLVNVKSGNVAIDLNGKTVTVDAAAADVAGQQGGMLLSVFHADPDAHLTITDSSNGDGAVNLNVNDANVYSFFATESPNGTVSGKITIDGGNYTSNGVIANAMIFTDTDEVITINGGNLHLDGVSTTSAYPWMVNTLGNNELQVVINGGTFNVDVNHQHRPFEIFVPETLALRNNGDGTWTVVPAVAYVTEKLGNTVHEEGNYVHKVGYATLADALAGLKFADRVTMLSDVALENGLTVEAGREFALDLNGKTVSMEDASATTVAMIKNCGNLTITDSSEEKAGKLSFNSTTPSAANAYASNVISNYGTITVEAGTIENTTVGSACYALDNYAGSTATINGGKLTAEKTTVRIFNWTNGDAAKATLNVNGGEIYSKDGYAINVNSGNAPSVALNITGGTITTDDTDYNLAVYVFNNGTAENFTATVTGGEFNGYFALNGATCTTMAENAVSISDGTFEGVICYDEPAHGFISGGVYNTPVDAAYCADGYAPYALENGKYGVEYLVVDEITIVDGSYDEFVNQNAKTVGTLTYERRLSGYNAWYALFVPFEIPVSYLNENGYEVATFYDVHFSILEGGVVDLTSVPDIHLIKINGGTLKANYPYVIRAKSDASLDLVITLADAKLYSTAKSKLNVVESSTTTTRFEFAGTYVRATGEELTGDANVPFYVITKQGEMAQFADPSSRLSPFRVYMTIWNKDGSHVILNGDPAASVAMRVIGEENEDGTTSIYDVYENVDSNGMIFDLQGRRVLEPQKGGMYIIDGKKVIY